MGIELRVSEDHERFVDNGGHVRPLTKREGCDHDWAERNQGPGFRWDECRMCGEQGEWKP